jgi:hypothetical protein
MLSSEPADIPDRVDESSNTVDNLVSIETKDLSEFGYDYGIAVPIIIFISANITCLGVTYSCCPCLSMLFFSIVAIWIPKLSRPYNRRIKRLSWLALFSVFPFGMCVITVDPIHGPNPWTRLYLLRLTPPGTPRSEVEALIAKKGWMGGKFYYSEDYNKIPKLQRPISVTLSHSEMLDLPSTHYAEWIFDEEGKVITVEVTTFAICL